MGVSTNGILFYGIDLGEDFEYDREALPFTDEQYGVWEEDGKEWEDLWAALHGVFGPSVEYGEENKEVFHAYWDKKGELEKTSPCEVDLHCSYEYPIYYVALRGANFTAYRGSPEEVSLDFPDGMTKEEADAKIKEFCEKMGLPYSQPKWYLASLWG